MSHVVGFPLYRRDGGVRAIAVIDASDADAVLTCRWAVDTYGYVHRSIRLGGGKQRNVLLHRQLMGLEHGDGLQIDHINGDKLDNRRENLRVCTNALNAQNRREGYGSSQMRGVAWHKATGKWAAYATAGGRKHHLGLFDSEREAADVAAAFRAEHMPFSAEAAA
jgi:hypothetical protein